MPSAVRPTGTAALPARLASDVPEPPCPETSPAQLRLRSDQAIALMRALAEEPVSITDIATRLNVSMRCLQLTFARTHGTTPRAMLTAIRLCRARERLLEGGADSRVTGIALDAGFTHLSRFSESYRRAFGERPIETLSRSRAPAQPQAAE